MPHRRPDRCSTLHPRAKIFDAVFNGGAIYLRERVPAEAHARVRHFFAART
jgi:hypothetical protein